MKITYEMTWIPCSNAMPTERTPVLVVVECPAERGYTNVKIAEYIGVRRRTDPMTGTSRKIPYWNGGISTSGHVVTHWMPLPIAPQDAVTKVTGWQE